MRIQAADIGAFGFGALLAVAMSSWALQCDESRITVLGGYVLQLESVHAGENELDRGDEEYELWRMAGAAYVLSQGDRRPPESLAFGPLELLEER